MRSLSSLGLALSIVFGFLLLALLGEIYYLLWWKKKRVMTRRDVEDGYSSPAREFLYMFCCKKPSPSSSLSSRAQNPQLCSSVRIRETHVSEPQSLLHHAHSNKDSWAVDDDDDVDESYESEITRLRNFSCHPRFLFTIKEETKEDLESEVGRSRRVSRSRSLSDLSILMETPFFTPLASSPYFTPPLSPLAMEFNPLFEQLDEAEFSRIKSSPPPILKFLKDAEEKLQRREAKDGLESKEVYEIEGGEDVEDGSFITLILAKNNKERKSNRLHHHKAMHHSSSSQVLPLAFSPSTRDG